MSGWRTIDSAPVEGKFDVWAGGRRVADVERSRNGGFRKFIRFQRDTPAATACRRAHGVNHYRAVTCATHWKPVDQGPSVGGGLHIEMLIPADGNATAHFTGGEGQNIDASLCKAIAALEAERVDLAACPYHRARG